MTESTEDQLQSEPGGSPAQASQKVQTKPVGAAGIGTPAAAVAAARSGIRQSPCTASPTQRPQIQIVAVIPVYDQPAKLELVVQSLRQLALPVIVVDDGSHEPTKSLCDRLAAPQVKVIHQPFNQGKGAAVIVGFKAAVRMG
ncbi:glycosyltransferase family 2 protein, partial [Sutterella wadsworthensis]